MPLIRQKWIKRADLRSNPERRYVFGDNEQRKGFGGQAKEMRGEPNSIGVVTKWLPSMQPDAFLDDGRASWEAVRRDLLVVQYALDQERTVVMPEDGIGTGLARLSLYAPRLDEYIREWFYARAG